MKPDEVVQFLEMIRDVLRLYSNFIRQVSTVEKEYTFDFSQLGDTFAKMDFTSMVQSMPGLSQQTHTAFISLLAVLFTVSTQMQNPLALKPSEKVDLADKLDSVVIQLENALGVGKVVVTPTDLDKQLIDLCANKNYHDTVTNAFALMEDKLRAKINVGREYSGDKLIDHAFNPSTGKLVLGDLEAEKLGVYFLFKGAFLFLRNPPSHTHGIIEDRNAALKILDTSDFLLKLIERASLRS